MEPATNNTQVNSIGVGEALKNTLMMIAFFGVILFILLGPGWKTVALVLSFIFTLITIVSLIGFCMVLFAAIGVIISEQNEIKKDSSGQVRGLFLTILVRFIEEAICVFLTIMLYVIFYVPGILIKG